MAALPARSVAVVIGTRPEAIKLAEVVERLGAAAWIVHTGQHYDAALAADVLRDIGFPPPHEHLGVGGSSRGAQLGQAITAIDALFATTRPAAVVVQGDTNATVAGALAANAGEIPLVHVEAGLRSRDRRMPEEHNRVVTDHLSDLCCAPTQGSVANLAAEGIGGDRVVLTGNTVVEAARRLLPPPGERAELLAAAGVESERFVLSTIHRPENVDDRDTLASVLGELAGLPLPVLLPLHPRTAARARSFGLDDVLDRLLVLSPQPPRAFLGLAAEAALWITDSGGLQEEASVLKRPVIVVRRSTERPEVLGTFADLIPPGPEVGDRAREWLEDRAGRASLAQLDTPYGDGSASARTVDALHRLLGVDAPAHPGA